MSLQTFVHETREQMGKAAATDIINKIKELLAQKESIRMIFAAAPSQNEVLAHLVASNDVEWNRIEAFHMDEYIGLPEEATQLFSSFLNDKIFKKVPFKNVNLINGSYGENECSRYANLLSQAPVDIVCLGIGENGHIAFNDPPVADFNDSAVVKKVKLDMVCRQQQVNDGCFPTLNDVPEYALTLTIPTLLAGTHLFCVVPGDTKREAVSQTLNNPEVTTEWPSTVLRNHSDCRFYFDKDSFGA